MPLFATLDTDALCGEINGAREHVILAATGIATETARALIAAHGRLQPGHVQVVLDVSAGVARLGFGDHQAVQLLSEAGVPVRNHHGLRIGVLICDGHGWSFAGTPRLVEADPSASSDAFNAIALTETQVIALRAELPQVGDLAHAASPQGASIRPDAEPLVGSESLVPEALARVGKALEIAPPRPFDLARRTMVYSALIQFVELHFEGFNIQSRRIQLPKSLPMLASKDKALKERLTTSLKLLDRIEKPAALTAVSNELDELRKAYLVPVGNAGRVMLKSKRTEFEETLEAIRTSLTECKQTLKNDLETALNAVVEAIAPELAKAVLADPPPRFRGLFPATQDAAMEYVREELGKALPKAGDLVEGMKVHCLFKDVTHEMLTDKEFGEKVLAQIPKSVLDGALLTEHEAAKASERDA